MLYFIALIESGKVIHTWTFAYSCDAIEHFSALNKVYEGVNEAVPVMFKCTAEDTRLEVKKIINSLIND